MKLWNLLTIVIAVAAVDVRLAHGEPRKGYFDDTEDDYADLLVGVEELGKPKTTKKAAHKKAKPKESPEEKAAAEVAATKAKQAEYEAEIERQVEQRAELDRLRQQNAALQQAQIDEWKRQADQQRYQRAAEYSRRASESAAQLQKLYGDLDGSNARKAKKSIHCYRWGNGVTCDEQ